MIEVAVAYMVFVAIGGLVVWLVFWKRLMDKRISDARKQWREDEKRRLRIALGLEDE